MRSTAVLASVFLFAACSEDHADEHSHELPADCVAIIDVCHEPDDGGGGIVGECHELAHAGDGAACTAQKASCVAACESAAADSGSAGSAGATSDAGP